MIFMAAKPSLISMMNTRLARNPLPDNEKPNSLALIGLSGNPLVGGPHIELEPAPIFPMMRG